MVNFLTLFLKPFIISKSNGTQKMTSSGSISTIMIYCRRIIILIIIMTEEILQKSLQTPISCQQAIPPCLFLSLSKQPSTELLNPKQQIPLIKVSAFFTHLHSAFYLYNHLSNTKKHKTSDGDQVMLSKKWNTHTRLLKKFLNLFNYIQNNWSINNF